MGAGGDLNEFKLSLKHVISRDNVFLYTNEFDPYVNDELNRANRVLFNQLDSYYWFDNVLNTDVHDIIYREIFNEQVFD